MYKTETRGRPETMIIKDILQYSISIGLENTEISKILNIGQMLVAHWIKFHQSSNFLREPEDDNEIAHKLRELQQFYPSVGFSFAVGHLR